MDVDDRSLAERLRKGDRQALQTIVDAYLRQVFRTACGCGLDHEQAEEVVQATFMVLIDKATEFRGQSKIRTWLFGILYRKVQEMRRKLGKERRQVEIEDATEDRFLPNGRWARPPLPVDKEIYLSQVRHFLDACMETLPTRHRLAFHLREVEELSTPEICKILDVTSTHLGVILFRARNALRDCLEAKGIEGAQL